MLTTLRWDLKYALRMLAQSPAFTGIAVAALTLGIGANSAIFTVVNSIVLRPLRFPESNQLVFVQERNLKAGFPRFSLSPGNYADFRDHNHSFSGFTAFEDQALNLAGGTEPQRLGGLRVTAEFFDVFGVKPALGRPFRADEMKFGSPKVAVLSYGLWQRRFAGSRATLGRLLKLNQELYTVVGVLPAAFEFGEKTDVLIPLSLDQAGWQQRGGHYLGGVARLKKGMTIAAAQADLNAIAARAEKEHPESNTGWDTILDSLQHTFVGDVENLLWMLSAAVGLVLLIACANVANLLLSRSAARRREIGIRSSLGAGTARILRQLLTESVLLASGGAAAGLALAWIATKMVSHTASEALPRAAEIAIDWRVVGFTVAMAAITGILFGIAPALDLTKTNLSLSLKEGGRGNTIGFRRNRLRSALVVGEIALILVLLTASGLLMRSFYNQQRADVGFDPHHVLSFTTELPEAQYKTNPQQAEFYQRALDRIRALPGVTAAGAAQIFPFGGGDYILTFTQIGKPKPAPGREPSAAYYAATPGYLAAMRIPIKRGRDFTEHDNASGPPVAIISEDLGRQFYPGEDPLGHKIQMGNGSKPAEIVGIVGDARDQSLTTKGRPAMYEPAAQVPFAAMTFAVRTQPEPETLIRGTRAAMREIDPDLPLDAVATLGSMMAKSVTVERFGTILMLSFAGLALVLAMIGIYGVLSYAVTQATQEIGIRMALGAQRRDVLTLVLRHAGILIALGIAIGMAGALGIGRLLASDLYEVKGTDPTVLGAVGVLAVATGIAACSVPALRAARLDPLEALREE